MKRRTFVITPLVAMPSALLAKDEFKLGGVSLLQPESVIAPRVRSVEALSAYIKAIEQATKQYFAETPNAMSRSGFVVIAVKPKQQSNAWFDFTPKLTAAESRELSARLRRVLPMQVSEGPVVFALQLGIAGGEPPKHPMPKPDEWGAEVAKAGRPIETGDLVLRVWRD